MTFAISGGDFTGNSVRICGSRPAPDPKYRCNPSLTPDVEAGTDAGDACPCFNFNADGSLVDSNGVPVVITGLCPSADFPPANWDFSYAIFTEPNCGGTQLNDGTHNFTCYDSTDIATQAFPNQSANDVLDPGLNTNHILCNTVNASKQWDFTSCAAATTPADTAAGNFRFDCGCTLVEGTCTCGDGGVTAGDLENGCAFDPVSCNIVCPEPVVPQGAGLAASGPSVVVTDTGVVAYIPHSGWADFIQNTDVSVVSLEGTSVSDVIETPGEVVSCASNSVTGQTVCVAKDSNEVYLLEGTTLTDTLHSAATGTIIPGENAPIALDEQGSCTNCAVAMDPVHNRALISLSLAGVPAYQFLDLATNTFLPAFTPQTDQEVALGFLIDPIRNLILSPTPLNSYDLIDVTDPATPKFFNRPTGMNPADQSFTSAGADCATGFALGAALDANSDITSISHVYVTDLKQAIFTPGAPAGTWTGPAQNLAINREIVEIGSNFGLPTVAIAQGTHQGVLSDAFGGNLLTAIQLPAITGAGTPALTDWVSCDIPDFDIGAFAQPVTAYKSPTTGHAMAVFFPYSVVSPTEIAVVDLTMMLDPAEVPRTALGHACAAGELPSSVVRIVPVP